MPYFTKQESFNRIRPLSSSIKRGKYDIPIIPKSEINLEKLNDGLFLQGFQNSTKKDTHCKEKIVHFFINDREFERLYEKSLKYIPRLAKYYAVRTPDFSRFDGRDKFGIIQATYRNRYLGALWSDYGRKVIPTIGWAGPASYEICFEGVETESIVSISTLGIHSDKESKEEFRKGFTRMRNKLNPSAIICLGDPVEGMNTDNVYFVPYQDSFGKQFQNGWQTRLFDLQERSK